MRWLRSLLGRISGRAPTAADVTVRSPIQGGAATRSMDASPPPQAKPGGVTETSSLFAIRPAVPAAKSPSPPQGRGTGAGHGGVRFSDHLIDVPEALSVDVPAIDETAEPDTGDYSADELADYSDVVYAHVPGGFPAPPFAEAALSPNLRGIGEGGLAEQRIAALPSSLASEMLQDLAARGRLVVTDLAKEPVLVEWPVSAGPGGAYFVAPLEPRFLVPGEEGTVGPRTLRQALPGLHGTEERHADDLDRLELVRLVGSLLARLHARDLLTSGATLDAFGFALAPRPCVVLLEPDTVRRLGGEAVRCPSRHERRSSMDTDRYEFAILAYELLVRALDGAGHAVPGGRCITGLTRDQDRELRRLWGRADGPPGTRPQLGEWMGVLSA